MYAPCARSKVPVDVGENIQQRCLIWLGKELVALLTSLLATIDASRGAVRAKLAFDKQSHVSVSCNSNWQSGYGHLFMLVKIDIDTGKLTPKRALLLIPGPGIHITTQKTLILYYRYNTQIMNYFIHMRKR